MFATELANALPASARLFTFYLPYFVLQCRTINEVTYRCIGLTSNVKNSVIPTLCSRLKVLVEMLKLSNCYVSRTATEHRS